MDCAGAVTRAVASFAREYPECASEVCVGLSGGADSLALTAGAVHAGLRVHCIIVDHRLQDGSADVADAAAAQARSLGASAEVRAVIVTGDGGLEAAARVARYEALRHAADGRAVLLGHTTDDQAETVLLGLARGSGARSIAGMRPWNPPWGRPLLGIRRAQTRGACAQWGLTPHDDPHNDDPRFTRVRVRTEVLPLLDEVLHGGVVDALSRTADQLRDDNDALDAAAALSYAEASETGEETPILRVTRLAEESAAIRRRVVRLWLFAVGATEPTARVIIAIDALMAGGSGAVAIGGDAQVRREVIRCGDTLTLRTSRRRQ